MTTAQDDPRTDRTPPGEVSDRDRDTTAEEHAGADEEYGAAPGAAPVPKRPAAIGWVGMILALLLTVLGIFALFDGAVRAGWVTDAEPVLTPFLTGPAVVTPQPGAAVVAVLVGLLSLWLLVTALKPGRRAGIRLGETAGIWMGHRDLERVAASAAERCDGVLSARARASSKRVVVHVETTTPEVEEAAAAAVRERLSALSAPRIDVRTTPRFERSAR